MWFGELWVVILFTLKFFSSSLYELKNIDFKISFTIFFGLLSSKTSGYQDLLISYTKMLTVPKKNTTIVTNSNRRKTDKTQHSLMKLPKLKGPLFSHFSASPFPTRMTCRHRYSIVNTVLSNGSTQYTIGTPFSMQLNDLTNTPGHQPYGYDQLRAIYSNFRVTHADFQLSVMTVSGSNDALTCLVGVYPNGATYPASGDQIDRWAEVAGSLVRNVSSAGNSVAFTIKQRIPIAAIEGLSQIQLQGSPNYAGFSGVAVPFGPELFVAVSNESATAQRGIQMKLDVVFTCEWWQRIQYAQS